MNAHLKTLLIMFVGLFVILLPFVVGHLFGAEVGIGIAACYIFILLYAAIYFGIKDDEHQGH